MYAYNSTVIIAEYLIDIYVTLLNKVKQRKINFLQSLACLSNLHLENKRRWILIR